MMTMILEMDDGTKLEAPDQKALNKEIKKYEAAQRAAMRERERKTTVAMSHAHRHACTMMTRFLNDDPVPRGWGRHDPATAFRKPTRHVDGFHRVYHKMRYETEGGMAEADHYGYTIRWIIVNGAGFDMAVYLDGNTDTIDLQLMAIGTFEDVVAFYRLPDKLIPWLETR
jgi:hypothetical protein